MLSICVIRSARAFPYSFLSFFFKTKKYSESSSKWSYFDPVIMITLLILLSIYVGCFNSYEVPWQYLLRSSVKYFVKSNFFSRISANSSQRAVYRNNSTRLVCKSDSMKAALLFFLSFILQYMAPTPNNFLKQYTNLSMPFLQISSQMNLSFLVFDMSTKILMGSMAIRILSYQILLLYLFRYLMIRLSRWYFFHLVQAARKMAVQRMTLTEKRTSILFGAYYN